MTTTTDGSTTTTGAPGTGDGTTTTTTTTATGTATEPTTLEEALAALKERDGEVEKWKTQSRKHEERSKANADAAKELEKIRASSMSETEKAVAEAKVQARLEALVEVGGKLATAELRAVAAGRIDDEQLSTLIENLDVTRFLDDDGEVDSEKVKKFVDGIAPPAEGGTTTTTGTTTRPRGDLGQGARGTTSSVALNGDPLLDSLKSKLGIR
jgi:hypothetical protein